MFTFLEAHLHARAVDRAEMTICTRFAEERTEDTRTGLFSTKKIE
jgi:hypothetical protein